MWNTAQTQTRINSAFIKTLQTKLLPYSKVVYFKKHLAYQVQHLWETKFPLPMNVHYHHQTIKLAVGAIVEPLHT